MTDLDVEVPLGPCACCGGPLAAVHVNLSYNEERVLESEIEIGDSVVLKSYCTATTCGVDAARKELTKLGVIHHFSEVPTLCAICGKVHVDLGETHATYVIGVDEFDGASFQTLNEPVVAVGCMGCQSTNILPAFAIL